jgi:hypothetical protein
MTVFWDVAPCSLVEIDLHHHDLHDGVVTTRSADPRLQSQDVPPEGGVEIKPGEVLCCTLHVLHSYILS